MNIISEKIFVTFSTVGDKTKRDGDYPLAFAVGIKKKYTEKQKAKLELRKQTMMNWAYSDCEKRNGLYVRTYPQYWYYKSKTINEESWVTHEYKLGNMKNPSYLNYLIRENTIFRIAKQPMTIDNCPVEGFCVDKAVSRCSTQNKLWRINDPRGFQLEMSTDNLMKLILNGKLENGRLIGKYYWDFGAQGIGKPNLIKYEEV